MTTPQPTPERSKCCKAKVRSIVDGTPLGGTGYYQCLACDKPCDLIIPQDTPPSADTSQNQTVKESLTVTPDNNSPLADTVGGNYVDSRTPEEKANEPSSTATSTGGPMVVTSTPPSKQSEEIRDYMGVKGLTIKTDPSLKENEMRIEVESTPPKAEGVGEWEKEFDKMFVCKTWDEGELLYENIREPTECEPIRAFIRNLLTSATRAAEERKDGEWREKIAKKIKDHWHMRYENVSDPGEKQARIGFNKEVTILINSVLQDLLPPPPSNQ